MRLLTWNIQWGCGRDGRIDLVRIAREIEVHAPDVVCLQEVVRGFPTLTGAGQERDDQPRVLAELFTGWAHAYVAALEQVDERGSRRQFGNMILSRLPLIEVRRHALPMPADPSVPAMPRAALECTLHAPWGPLAVVTTHLEYYSARQRLAQVDALRRLLAENAAHAVAPRPPGGPDEPHFAAPPRAADAILCGDFNCPPDSPELSRLCMPLQPAECAAAGFDATAAVPPPLCFRDAWRIAHGDAPHAPTAGLVASADFPAPVCFDFAFVAGSLAARLQTIRVDAATVASDHQPLIVDFASRMDSDSLLSQIERLAEEADSMDALSSEAMAIVAEAIPADRRTLFVLDAANMSLRSAFADGLGREIIVPLRIGVIGSAILRRRPMRVSDAYEHPYFCPDIDTSLGFRTRSLLVAPMLARTTGRALGGIEMLNKIGGDFTSDDAAELASAAARLARWIEDDTLYAAGVEAECIAMRNTLRCERASVFALEPRTSRLVALYADGDDGRVLSLNMRLGIAGLVAITALPVLLDDAWSDTRFDRSVDTRTGYRTRSMLCAPTREPSGHANGVIQLINAAGGRFNASQMALLEAMGQPLSRGIARLATQADATEQ